MNAILKFKTYKGEEIMSGITCGQNELTHKHLNGANDYNGMGPAPERCDLLAPFDCKVMAIAPGDNAVFFQSTGEVLTPTGKYANVWFMCVHCLDADMKTLGMKVGKVFKQGEPCYTEGTKGIGSGPHIHMEQGFGTFGGGTLPYYKSKDTYTYNGKLYYQYYPNVASGGAECPVYDIFYQQAGIKHYLSETEKANGAYYANRWKVWGEKKEENDSTVIELQLALSEAQNSLKAKEDALSSANKELSNWKSKYASLKESAEAYKQKLLSLKTRLEELIGGL